MAKIPWTKKDILAHFRVKSWGTIWRWQRDRNFPLGRSVGGRLLFDEDAIRKWEQEQERPHYVKGVSTGARPKYNCDRAREAKEPEARSVCTGRRHDQA